LNGRPGNVLLPFRETTCSPFFAFRGLKIRFMPSHEPHCPIVLFKVNVQRHSKRPNSLPGWKDKGQGQTRTTQAFEMCVLETYFCRFVKRPVARFMYFGGLKIRFMTGHESHCPIVLIQGQISNVMRKDQIRGQGERSNGNDTDLWNGRPGNVLLPFRETTCRPFSAFWRPENKIYAEFWTPLSNRFNSKSKFKGHAIRPNSWPGWNVKDQGQRWTTQAFEMGVLET